MDNYLEEFGEIFIKEVRDRTIDIFDRKTARRRTCRTKTA